MIGSLNGKLIEKNPTALIIECSGVGYEVKISLTTFSAIGSDESIKVFTQFIVREDAQLLFGFATKEERDIFNHLISVSGIGPKTALTALSGIPVPELKRAIIDGDLAVLTGVSGIGKKTAERMIVELREKRNQAVGFKYRIEFSKIGPITFITHIDL